MKCRLFISFFISASVFFPINALALEFSARTFYMQEEGPASMGTVAGLALGIEKNFETSSGLYYAQASLFAGTFIGETLGFSLGLGYRHALGSWYPGIGVVYALDFGSRLIYAMENTGIPPTPLGYAGLKIDPLHFVIKDYAVSALGLTLSRALLAGAPVYRAEIDLLGLSFKPGSRNRRAAENRAMAFSTSFGMPRNTFGNGKSVFSVDAVFRYGSFEAALSAASLANPGNSLLPHWAVSAGVYFSPLIGHWHPSIGTGILSANPDPVYNGFDYSFDYSEKFVSVHFHLKPLRFAIPLSQKYSIMLSAFELRFGPLFRSGARDFTDSGSFMGVVDFFRAGIAVRL